MPFRIKKNQENQRRKPKQARALAKYDAVLDACTQLLLEKGYHQTSMLELSLVSEVAIPSIYQYFPNKEGVFRAWFERLGEQVFQSLPELASAQEQGDIVEVYISHALMLLAQQRQSAKALLNELPSALTTDLIKSLEQQSLSFVEGLFGSLLGAHLDQQKLLVLIRLLLGYMLQIILNPDRELNFEFETKELAGLVKFYLFA